ncbi:LacI family DNA-binding transcriptional regulator [Acidocella facilis]|uniref:LacI family DNA-binding transcriptional regulator n=1 Tax=Acidocella facilis TaxID=525 RepID=UPI00047D2A37|nr:LacI family DNA-binding transcriptional regulator [Acidocella facilis]
MASPTDKSAPRLRRKTDSVTMQDVARLAGCATSTVSLFLRKPDLVKGKTGAKITAAIERLGYVPNMMAGGLAAAAATRVVSLIVPSLRNAFFAATADALQAALAQAGVQLLLGHNEYDPAREEALVRASLAWSPAALVLTGLEHSRGTRQMALSRGTPVIEMWELGANPLDMLVGFDHRAVGAAAARHLRAAGCKNVAFIGARLQEDRRAAQRGSGVIAALQQEGASARQAIAPQPASVALGEALLGELLERDPKIDGVVCSNDWIALGVLFECQKRGIAVPERLKIIGFGDLPFAAATYPALSTIRPPGERIGQEVARLALAALNGETVAQKTVDVGFELVRRGTS